MAATSVKGAQSLNCVRSEIHNVLSTMRVNGRWASEERFVREIPLQLETPLMRSFKTLHNLLQGHRTLEDVDAVTFLEPFLDVISFPNTNGDMTSVALQALNKFLLYGSINEESPRGREAINVATEAVVHCRFESSSMYDDEVILMRLLEVLVNLVRCPAGPFISDLNIWKIVETCARLSNEPAHSQLLRKTAENSLTHIILTVFARVPDLITPESVYRAAQVDYRTFFEHPSLAGEDQNPLEADIMTESDNGGQSKDNVTAVSVEHVPIHDCKTGSSDHEERFSNDASCSTETIVQVGQRKYDPYGVTCMVRILHLLADLAEPANNTVETRCTSLRLINIVLETGGEDLARQPAGPKGSPTLQSPILTVLQGNLCKYLLRNSQDGNLDVLALTLRVIFNLFSAVKEHLKVQLEVFLTSVHLRIAESKSVSFEHKELALESLLDFCREPTLMLDLYTNYDCDVRCTNLFETLCKCLCRCAIPAVNPTSGIEPMINSLHNLAHEGVMCVVDAIASRCVSSKTSSSSPTGMGPVGAILRSASCEMDSVPPESGESTTFASSTGKVAGGDCDEDDDEDGSHRFGWLESARERTAVMLRERKAIKRRLMLAAKQFNKKPNGDYWQEYAQDLGILPSPATAEDVAKFLREAPGLDKTAVGEYITEPPDRHPFSAEVLAAYLATFNFEHVRIDGALRLLLESFRLPGEAQKIERIMEAFGNHYCAQNPREENLSHATPNDTDTSEVTMLPDGTTTQTSEASIDVAVDDNVDMCRVFKSPDAAFIFAFSIIMLHTDLHNKNIPTEKKMTLDGFVRNNRGINEGEDLPRKLLEHVYSAIQQRQIRMLYDPHAHLGDLHFDENQTSQGLSADSGATWDGILRHSEMVAGASFTPSHISHSGFFRAGVHERDMFTYIFDNVMDANAVVLEFSSDGRKVVQAIEGFCNLAKISVYYDMIDIFNRIVITLSKYFERFQPNLLDGIQTEKDLLSLQQTCTAIEAFANAHMDTIEMRHDPVEVRRPLNNLDSNVISMDVLKHEMHVMELNAAHPSCISLLIFRALLSMPLEHGDAMRESWHNILRAILYLNKEQLLPNSFVEIDDIADAHGQPLPTAGRKTSPTAVAHIDTAGDTSQGSVVSTLRRESVDSEPRRASVGRPVSALLTRREQQREGNAAASTVGQAPPPSGMWNALASFFLAPQENLDHLRVDASEVIQATLHACDLERLFSRTKRLSAESLTHLLDALLVPFGSRGSSGTTQSNETPIDEPNTILCLELLTTVALANSRRFHLVWPVLRQIVGRVHRQDKNTKSNQASEQSDETLAQSSFLLERVVVNLFRLCMRMLDNPEAASDLICSLEFLNTLPDDQAKPLAARVGSGLATVIKVQAANIVGKDNWRVVTQLLLRYLAYPEAAEAIWSALECIIDRGYVSEANLDMTIECCVHFVRLGAKIEPTKTHAPVSPIVQRARDAVFLLLKLSHSVFAPGFESSSTRRGNSDVKSPEEIPLAEVVPNSSAPKHRERCWLLVVKEIANLLGEAVPSGWLHVLIFNTLQQALSNEKYPIPGTLLLACFDTVVFPLVEQTKSEGEDAHTRSVKLLAGTFLHNIHSLAEATGIHMLWLRVVTSLAIDLREQKGTVYETALETFRNMVLVVRSMKLLDSGSLNEGQNVWQLTWNVVESNVPGGQKLIEEAFSVDKSVDSVVDTRNEQDT